MTREKVLLDSLIGNVKSYGIDMPASLNEAGERVIYLTKLNNKVETVGMDTFMKHELFKTFSIDAQIKLNHWHKE